MNQLLLIIQREYLYRVKTKVFLFSTLLVPLAFAIMLGLPAYIDSASKVEVSKIYVIDNTGKYYQYLKSSSQYEFIPILPNQRGSGGKMEAMLEISGDLDQSPHSVTFFSDMEKPPQELTAFIKDALSQAVTNERIERFAVENNMGQEAVDDLRKLMIDKQSIMLNTYPWSGEQQSSSDKNSTAENIGMTLNFIMFFFIMMYGSMVMQSVVEEKSSRIVELIVSSVSAFHLLMGKIISVAMVGLTQICIWSLLGIIFSLALRIGSTSDMQALIHQSSTTAALFDLQRINWIQIFGVFILYFIGGYLLFASLYAMFASGANDSQEAQQFTFPLTLLLLICFYTGYAAVNNPNGNPAFWCSMIPFTSPIVMLARAPFDIPIWELIISLILLYGSAIYAVRFAARIYRVGIMMYGQKVNLIQLFKWINYK